RAVGADEVDHVLGRAGEAVGGRHRGRVDMVDGNSVVGVGQRRVPGRVVGFSGDVVLGKGVRQGEYVEDVLTDVVHVPVAGGRGDDQAEHRVSDVGVLEAFVRWEHV